MNIGKVVEFFIVDNKNIFYLMHVVFLFSQSIYLTDVVTMSKTGLPSKRV